jgi:RNA polymerase sigma-70 factor (ECF subfamily)
VQNLLSDEQLMEQVKQGDLTKSSDLFDRYHKHLYNFFVKISYDRDLGNDLTQNVFLRMIKFKHTYRADGKFKSWIFQIARNVYADHHRANKQTFSKEVFNLSDQEDAIDVKWAKSEEEKLLYIAMYGLSTEQREVLLMSKFQKMKYQEIAEIYETSEGAIKTKVHRAIKKLQENYFKLEKI